MSFIYLSIALFCVGLYGVLIRRDIVGILASVEVMLGSTTLLLVGLSAISGAAATPTGAGALGAAGLVVIVLATAEASVGLALLVVVARKMGTASVDELQEVRG